MLADRLDYHSNLPKIGLFGEAMNKTAKYRPGRDLRVVMKHLAKPTKQTSLTEAEICRNWAKYEPVIENQKVQPSKTLSCPCMESEIEDTKIGIESIHGEIHARDAKLNVFFKYTDI